MSLFNKSQSVLRQMVGCMKSLKNFDPICTEIYNNYSIPIRTLYNPKVAPLKLGKEFRNNEVANVPDDFRYVYRDFLPSTFLDRRHRLKEKIEREDMLCRRETIDIPEFYVGSILAVSVSDPNASGKLNRFVGICILRELTGLHSRFTLRNVVDNIGVEINYEMYCPLLQSIEVLRIEKRLDDDLSYLRDCLPEFSTFPFDMIQEPLPQGAPVPINRTKAKFKPRPWSQRWERKDLKGVENFKLPFQFAVRAEKVAKPWEKYDLMREYRNTITEEEQAMIYKELAPHMPKLEAARRKVKRVRLFKD